MQADRTVPNAPNEASHLQEQLAYQGYESVPLPVASSDSNHNFGKNPIMHERGDEEGI